MIFPLSFLLKEVFVLIVQSFSRGDCSEFFCLLIVLLEDCGVVLSERVGNK